MLSSTKIRQATFGILLLTVLYVGTPAVGLIAGIALALTLGNPYLARTRQWAPRLLTYSIVGLGAGMNLITVARVGIQGIGYTAVGIMATILLGELLSFLLKTDSETASLISVGTAICGGSAIAAVASATRAKDTSVSVALATVFVLNALALLIFPFIGHQLHLTQTQFGLWSALAIHDTSSVVGAAMAYGSEALQIATTVKLARALWIIPVTLVFAWQSARSQPSAGKFKRPWFILWFLLTAAAFTAFPALHPISHYVTDLAKRGLVLSLFCIGSALDKQTLNAIGIRPVVLGVVLWAIVATATLVAIFYGAIFL
jgi:uncharacterized integral membrane protein (TIGR00698 family)